jgi:hypothetical protein
MNGINKFLLLACIGVFNFGCNSGLSAKDYLQYFEKNRDKYCKKIKRNGMVANVGFVPNEYYAAREMAADTALGRDKALRKYENSMFFIFSINSGNNGHQSVLLSKDGAAGFKDNVMQNNFDRDQDIFLLHGSDTVKAAACNYERNWGFGNDDVFLIGFPRINMTKDSRNYRLVIRNIVPELGTIDVKLSEIVLKGKKIKG